METLGKRYDITKERVRQIFKKGLTRLSYYSFNLYSEAGVLRYISRVNYFGLFINCPIDAFILYLNVEKYDYIVKAFHRVILHGVQVPEDLRDRINTARNLLKDKQGTKSVKAAGNTIKHNGFQVIIDDDGEVLTDLELLNKLKQARLNLANERGVPVYCIYNNKHLVLLATFKPVNRTMYSSLRGFTDKTWDTYGSVIVNIIKEHIESK